MAGYLSQSTWSAACNHVGELTLYGFTVDSEGYVGSRDDAGEFTLVGLQ